ncbi:MAG TPA: hypothetical protein VES39_01340 [Rhodospirillales bacterium]|jgi:hypothetical protein|nr:hypothetical protein [Rhodospirillales bacterium]
MYGISRAEAWPGARIPEIVRDLTATAIAVFSRDGILIDANRGFSLLLPDWMTAAELLDVRDLFVNPRFDRFVTSRPSRPGGVVYDGILNLGSDGDSPVSLRGMLYAQRDSLMLVGEHEISGLELLRTKLLKLNDELATEQRRLALALRDLKRQRARAETAVREREAMRAQMHAGKA